MKEKLFLSVFVLMGLMLILAYSQTPVRSESALGRYQIIVAPASSDEGVQVFKLDTVTGKTWQKALVVEGGAKVVVFGIVQDYPGPKPR